MVQICIFLLLLVAAFVQSQRIPDIPCPGVFKYAKHDNLIHGVITVPNDFTGVYEIGVNVSLAILLNKGNIQLTLVTFRDQLNNGANPVYKVDFPLQTIIPKITQVIFNGKLYCSGPPEQMSPRGVTNMWATRTLITNIIPSQSGFNNQDNFNNQNNFNTNPNFNNEPQYVPYPNNPFATRPEEPPVSRPVVRPQPQPPVRRPPPRPVQQPVTSPPQPEIIVTPPTQKPYKPNTAIMERNDDNCGIFSQTLIVGGADVHEGEFPWLVAIFQKLRLNYVYRCTGNLITEKHLISAGHCFKFLNTNFHKDDYTLVLGKQDISQWPLESTIRGIKNMLVHPNFKLNTGDYDIAVLEMDRPVQYTDSVRPLCLWPIEDLQKIVGKRGTVVGWGTDGTENHTQLPKKVDLTVVSNEECLRSHWAFANLTSERTFCAGGKGVGPCSGDSGAGIIMQIQGKWTLRGVVSQALQSNGTVLCDLGRFIVFADVYRFLDWIQDIIYR